MGRGEPVGKPLVGGHTGGVDCVTMDPDGNRKVSGSMGKTIRVWEVAAESRKDDSRRLHAFGAVCSNQSR